MADEHLEEIVNDAPSVMNQCIERYDKLVDNQEKMLLASKKYVRWGCAGIITGFVAYELAGYAEPVSQSTKVVYEVIKDLGLGVGIIAAVYVVSGGLGVYFLGRSVERLRFAVGSLKKCKDMKYE